MEEGRGGDKEMGRWGERGIGRLKGTVRSSDVAAAFNLSRKLNDF